MKCEFLEGLSSVLVALFFCAVLIMPATIVGCAKEATESTPAPTTTTEPAPTDQGTEATDAATETETPAQIPAP